MNTILFVVGEEQYEHDQVLGFFPDTVAGLALAREVKADDWKNVVIYRVPVGVQVNRFQNDFERV